MPPRDGDLVTSKVRGTWVAVALLAFLPACQSDDKPSEGSASPRTPAASPSTSPEDVGLHPLPLRTGISRRARSAWVVVNSSGDVAVLWFTGAWGTEDWDELLTVVPGTGAARAYEADAYDLEIVGVPTGFVIGPGSMKLDDADAAPGEQPPHRAAVESDMIVLRSDGTVTKLRQVPAPTSLDRQGLVRPPTKTWYVDPVTLTWWPEAEPDEGSDVVIDDHGRVWLLPVALAPGSYDEVVIPEWGRAEWWYVGEHDAAHSKSHAHRTHAINPSLVVVGDRVALASVAWIDQSRDNTLTWKSTRLDERWTDYGGWFGTPSGRLFSSPREDRVFLRNRDESWTSFEKVSLPRGFTDLQAAGDLLWSVRFVYPRKNAEVPVEVVISVDAGDTWRHVLLRNL
jgi:hypothetical protein